jgi:hypothetical protein
MLLLDDKGHAGWELAEALGMEDSNLSHLLKELKGLKFIFQGPPRKSTRPTGSNEHKKTENVKKSRKKRDGDYKEFPFYLNKDLSILESLIREMVVTNQSYDTGFPFRLIRTSNYFRSMNDLFKEDFNKCLANLQRKLHIGEICYERDLMRSQGNEMTTEELLRLLSLEIFEKHPSPIHEGLVSEEMLEELEVWWFKYNMRSCLSEDTGAIIDNEKFFKTLEDFDIYGYDINAAILGALKKIGCHLIVFPNDI